MRFLNKKYLLLCGALLLGACGKPDDVNDRYLGLSVNDIQVLDLDGAADTLGNTLPLYGDKPVVLNVWATWCPPCLKELPSLDALAKEGTYTVVALATDKTVAPILAYLQNQPWGAHLKVLHDPAGRATYGSIGARALPMTYILDKHGTIKGIEAGERDWNSANMRAKIASYLK